MKLIIYDFDGVFTDNKVIVREDGVESVVVNRADGLAVSVIKSMGIEQIILTTEKNRIVQVRAHKLGIPAKSGVDDKKKNLLSYCKRRGIPLKSVAYVGNDLNDLEAMKMVGHPICPSDAYEQVRNICKIVLESAGGEGVARELLEYIK
ncbi:MAG: HAD hydrolase family protein [Nitrospirae bacterium]|nr:HAD hydrolase family protein [Nitrospirota bacterium]